MNKITYIPCPKCEVRNMVEGVEDVCVWCREVALTIQVRDLQAQLTAQQNTDGENSSDPGEGQRLAEIWKSKAIELYQDAAGEFTEYPNVARFVETTEAAQ